MNDPAVAHAVAARVSSLDSLISLSYCCSVLREATAPHRLATVALSSPHFISHADAPANVTLHAHSVVIFPTSNTLSIAPFLSSLHCTPLHHLRIDNLHSQDVALAVVNSRTNWSSVSIRGLADDLAVTDWIYPLLNALGRARVIRSLALRFVGDGNAIGEALRHASLNERLHNLELHGPFMSACSLTNTHDVADEHISWPVLESLSLSYDMVSDATHAFLLERGRVPQLRTVELRRCFMKLSLPLCMTSLSYVNSLSLHKCGLTNEPGIFFGQLSQTRSEGFEMLEELAIEREFLSDEVIQEIEMLLMRASKLRYLSLAYCTFRSADYFDRVLSAALSQRMLEHLDVTCDDDDGDELYVRHKVLARHPLGGLTCRVLLRTMP